MIPELAELNDLRLSDDLSYRQLEELTGVSYRTLYQLLTTASPRPYDRTLYKIRLFLEKRKAAPRRRRA